MALMTATDAPEDTALGGLEAWIVWSIAVAFVIYYFSFQTGYAIVNPLLQKEVGLSRLR